MESVLKFQELSPRAQARLGKVSRAWRARSVVADVLLAVQRQPLGAAILGPAASRLPAALCKQVYLTLAGALAVASVGAAFNMYTGLGGLLAVLGFMVAVPWLLATPAVPATLRKRQALLGAAAFSQGALLGPLVGAAVQINPR